MKVVHFLPSTFAHFFQRGQKVTLLGVFGDFSRFCQVYSFDGTMDPFLKNWIFEQTGTFWFFVLSALLTRVHFCLFLVVFSKPQNGHFGLFCMSRDTAESFGRKSDICNFKMTILPFFSLFFMISGPFHISTRPGGEVPGAQRQTGRAKTVKKNGQKSSKISHFQTKSAFCWFCTNFDHFELNLCIGTMCHFYFESKILFQVWKTWNFVNFAHFHIFVVPKISA